jgi:hypothetical protein
LRSAIAVPLYNILYIRANPFGHLVEGAFSICDWRPMATVVKT